MINQKKDNLVFHNPTKKGLIILLLLFFGTMKLMAQNKKEFLSAKESDPKNFGWMQGFPPPKDKVLHSWDGSFFEFPAIRWSVVHMRQLLPTINVSRGLEAPSTLPYELDKNIDGLTFIPRGQKDPMTWEESLWKNYTDGMIILHKGKVIYERYFGALTQATM
jgi:hypothetical protein